MNRGLGERISFIWLVIATLVIVLGAFLANDALKDAVVEEVVVAIEHFEQGHGEAKKTNGGEHIEEVSTGVLINDEQLDMLAHLIYGEAGSKHLPDEMQLATGSVLLNRIKSPLFPNTMQECIYQTGQYSCLNSGYLLTPDERTYANARYLLINGSQLPDNVLFQSQFKQGDGVYKKIGNQYYCYKN